MELKKCGQTLKAELELKKCGQTLKAELELKKCGQTLEAELELKKCGQTLKNLLLAPCFALCSLLGPAICTLQDSHFEQEILARGSLLQPLARGSPTPGKWLKQGYMLSVPHAKLQAIPSSFTTHLHLYQVALRFSLHKLCPQMAMAPRHTKPIDRKQYRGFPTHGESKQSDNLRAFQPIGLPPLSVPCFPAPLPPAGTPPCMARYLIFAVLSLCLGLKPKHSNIKQSLLRTEGIPTPNFKAFFGDNKRACQPLTLQFCRQQKGLPNP